MSPEGSATYSAAGVTGSGELLDVDAENRTQLLCKSSAPGLLWTEEEINLPARHFGSSLAKGPISTFRPIARPTCRKLKGHPLPLNKETIVQGKPTSAGEQMLDKLDVFICWRQI